MPSKEWLEAQTPEVKAEYARKAAAASKKWREENAEYVRKYKQDYGKTNRKQLAAGLRRWRLAKKLEQQMEAPANAP